MKLILLADIKGIGRKNSLVDVADGYALNFVLPKKLGIRATPAEVERHGMLVKKDLAEIERLKKAAIKIAHTPLPLKLKTGAQGVVFDSLTKDDVERAVKAAGYADAKETIIEKPIRTAGEHQATVRFGHGIEAKITIVTTT